MSLFKTFAIIIAITIATIDIQANSDNSLNFMVGTWKTEGTQYWGNGQWVEHKGIVKCKLLEDGVTLERTFWAAFANGVSLGGKSIHRYDSENKTWSGQWIPTLGTWTATPAIGQFEGKDFVEEATGSDQSGKFKSVTRFSEITKDSYSVSTDLIYDSGTVSENNWNIKFTKIEVNPCSGDAEERIKNLDFMSGEWVAEGKLLLQNGTTDSHISYVEAQTDGKKINQNFWGAIGKGGALCGISVFENITDNTWETQWTPAQGAPAPIAKGQIVNGKYKEEYAQSSGNGASEVVTTYHKLSDDCYKVQTDVIGENGEITQAVWSVVFVRI